MQTGALLGAVVKAGEREISVPAEERGPPASAASPWAGGISCNARRSMGLACDHPVGVEMVIPSGKPGCHRVIRADEPQHADLWASRGVEVATYALLPSSFAPSPPSLAMKQPGGSYFLVVFGDLGRDRTESLSSFAVAMVLGIFLLLPHRALLQTPALDTVIRMRCWALEGFGVS